MTRVRFTGAFLALLLIALSLPVVAAGATRIVTPGGARLHFQDWIDQSKVPTPDLTLTVREEACPGAPWVTGCVSPVNEREIFLRPEKLRDKTPSRRRIILLHEVGHMVDFNLMDDGMRDEVEAILGLQGKAWDRPRKRHPGVPVGRIPGPPMEKFAQAYAECAVKGPTIRQRPRRPIRYRYRPSPAQHAAMCQFVKSIPGL